MSIRRTIVTLLASTLVAACTQFTPYRPPVETKVLADMEVVSVADDPDLMEPRAIQHRSYVHQFEGDEPQHGDYYLSFVEFDDQGWFAERRQMDELLTLLDQLEERGKETLIYVYAHGWMHNASPCDNNVVYFSRLLERTDVLGRRMLEPAPESGPDQGTYKGRAVVGVYIGWRGLPYEAGFLTNFSFWNRKDTAARVGRGGVFELLVRLNDHRVRRQKDRSVENSESLPTQLIITGHSFGGLVIYSALSHALMERGAKATRDTSEGESRPSPEKAAIVEGFGDLVMLVNPAFEGSRYEPLHQIARHSVFSPEQRPLLMIVTSKADAATRVAFPAGQTMGTLFDHTNDSYQSDSLRHTVGHNEAYRTHELYLEPSEEDAEAAEEEEDPKYPLLGPTAKWNLFSLWNLVTVEDTDAAGATIFGPGVRLRPVSYETGDPYLVVSTDENIIADHNAIYNERFITFTQLFFLRYVTFQGGQEGDFKLPGSPAGNRQESEE